MPTDNVVPNADNEGELGTATKRWKKAKVVENPSNVSDVVRAEYIMGAKVLIDYDETDNSGISSGVMSQLNIPNNEFEFLLVVGGGYVHYTLPGIGSGVENAKHELYFSIDTMGNYNKKEIGIEVSDGKLKLSEKWSDFHLEYLFTKNDSGTIELNDTITKGVSGETATWYFKYFYLFGIRPRSFT